MKILSRKLDVLNGTFEGITRKERVKNIIITLIWIIFFCVRLLDNLYFSKSKSKGIIVFDFCMIVFACCMLTSYIIKDNIIRNTNLKVENLEKYNENLINQNETVRSFRHDFNNIIQAMSGYILLKDMESLEKYFKKLKKECNYLKNRELLNPKIIKSPAIYGVLISKYNIAEQFNIDMNVEVVTSPEFDSKDEYEISRIFGILLDNAIDATKKCEKKVINIQLCKVKNCKDLIIIENTYNDPELDTEKIFEKNYTTKKDTKNSGLGLWKVRNILSKNTYFDLYTTKDNEIFKQQLEIYKHT